MCGCVVCVVCGCVALISKVKTKKPRIFRIYVLELLKGMHAQQCNLEGKRCTTLRCVGVRVNKKKINSNDEQQ